MNKIKICFLLCQMIWLTTSCTTHIIYVTEEEEIPSAKMRDSVRVEFLAPEVYSYISPSLTSTRDGDTNSETAENTDNETTGSTTSNGTTYPSIKDRLTAEQANALKVVDLEEGQSLWLLFQEAEYNNDDKGDYVFKEAELRAYKVSRSAAGYTTFIPRHISTTDDGKKVTLTQTDEDAVGAPLYLDVGHTYRFLIMSPALALTTDELRSKEKYNVEIKNGIYFASTDNRYEESRAIPETITDNVDVNGIHYVRLRPIVEQTARIKLTIESGKGVNSMSLMDSGVEISGLQNAYEGKPSDEEKNYYLWSMTNVSDSIIMQKGDKNTRVVINAKDFTRSEEDGKITLTGDVGILPTDIMSTTMYILVNIEVNGVPTQYVAALNSMKFYHGFSYNVKLQVTANEGIFVNTWYNESWTKDLTPD